MHHDGNGGLPSDHLKISCKILVQTSQVLLKIPGPRGPTPSLSLGLKGSGGLRTFARSRPRIWGAPWSTLRKQFQALDDRPSLLTGFSGVPDWLLRLQATFKVAGDLKVPSNSHQVLHESTHPSTAHCGDAGYASSIADRRVLSS